MSESQPIVKLHHHHHHHLLHHHHRYRKYPYQVATSLPSQGSLALLGLNDTDTDDDNDIVNKCDDLLVASYGAKFARLNRGKYISDYEINSEAHERKAALKSRLLDSENFLFFHKNNTDEAKSSGYVELTTPTAAVAAATLAPIVPSFHQPKLPVKNVVKCARLNSFHRFMCWCDDLRLGGNVGDKDRVDRNHNDKTIDDDFDLDLDLEPDDQVQSPIFEKLGDDDNDKLMISSSSDDFHGSSQSCCCMCGSFCPTECHACFHNVCSDFAGQHPCQWSGKGHALPGQVYETEKVSL